MMSAWKFGFLLLLIAPVMGENLILLTEEDDLADGDGPLYTDVDLNELPEMGSLAECVSKNVMYCIWKCNNMNTTRSYCTGIVIAPEDELMFLVNNQTKDYMVDQLKTKPTCLNYLLKVHTDE